MQEPKSNISIELTKYSKQIAEIQYALDSIKLMDIDDVLERLDATIKKETAMAKLAPLIIMLDEMRNKHKVVKNDIKGSKTLSPLEDGTLEDE